MRATGEWGEGSRGVRRGIYLGCVVVVALGEKGDGCSGLVFEVVVCWFMVAREGGSRDRVGRLGEAFIARVALDQGYGVVGRGVGSLRVVGGEEGDEDGLWIGYGAFLMEKIELWGEPRDGWVVSRRFGSRVCGEVGGWGVGVGGCTVWCGKVFLVCSGRRVMSWVLGGGDRYWPDAEDGEERMRIRSKVEWVVESGGGTGWQARRVDARGCVLCLCRRGSGGRGEPGGGAMVRSLLCFGAGMRGFVEDESLSPEAW
ncbi:hypothetical protein Tco_0425152 [Tanacetum coccineum]